MFVLEALPAVMLGVISFFFLADGPAGAKWLTEPQRQWLANRLADERSSPATRVGHLSLWQVMANKYVLAASLIYAGASGASQCLSLWQPQIIKSFGLTNMQTGLLNSMPFGVASLLMLVWGRNSDRMRERKWHTAVPLALLAASLACAPLTDALTPTIIILCVAVTATYIVKGPFWALSTEWMSAGVAAAAIAQVNAIGNLGGFFGSYMLGAIKDARGSYALGLMPLAVLSAIGCILVLALSRRREQPATTEFSAVH
jgi:MFS transporter, ACS family, tartrate transporter